MSRRLRVSLCGAAGSDANRGNPVSVGTPSRLDVSGVRLDRDGCACLLNPGRRGLPLLPLIPLSTALLTLRSKAGLDLVDGRLIEVRISASGSIVGTSALQERVAPTVKNGFAALGGARRLVLTLALIALCWGTRGLGSGSRSLRLKVGLGHDTTVVVRAVLALVAHMVWRAVEPTYSLSGGRLHWRGLTTRLCLRICTPLTPSTFLWLLSILGRSGG